MKRVFPYLRIAWTVFFGVLAVLLCVLWVRSYWHTDSLTQVDNNGILKRMGTNSGTLFLGWVDFKTSPTISPPDVTDGWEYQEYDSEPMRGASPSWSCAWGPTEAIVAFPAWLATLLSLALAVAPWVHWSKSFSLRTLLIAITLVSFALGVIIYLTKSLAP